MPVHDQYARRTPFERAFPDPDFPGRHFTAVETEARERGVALTDPGVFAMLGAAVAALEELKVPGPGDDDEVTRLGALLFHAFHHQRAGCPVLLVRTGVVRYLVDTELSDPSAAGQGGLPANAYVQLPQHLVWTRAGEAGRPLSLDGFFWTEPGDGMVHVLAVAGLLEERPGFTVIPLPAVPLDDAALWAGSDMRPEGQKDFSTDLPGSEMEGLYEVRTAGELLKLGARLDVYLARFPDACEAADPPSESPGTPSSPGPSALAHRLVTLH